MFGSELEIQEGVDWKMVEITNPNPRLLYVYRPGTRHPTWVLEKGDVIKIMWDPDLRLNTDGGVSKVVFVFDDDKKSIQNIGAKRARIKPKFEADAEDD